jgi:hypothetical protein
MVGDNRPTTLPEASAPGADDPFGPLLAGAQIAKYPTATPPAVAGTGVARFNGSYVGQFCQGAYAQFPPLCWPATVVVSNGAFSGNWVSRTGTPHSWRGTVTAAGAVDMHYDSISAQAKPGAAAPGRLKGTINGNVMELTGRWLLIDRTLNGRFQRRN